MALNIQTSQASYSLPKEKETFTLKSHPSVMKLNDGKSSLKS